MNHWRQCPECNSFKIDVQSPKCTVEHMLLLYEANIANITIYTNKDVK
jgi:hypothetical protein